MTTRQIRHKRTQSRLKNSTRLRLNVYKSAKYVYAQLIDDNSHSTIVAVHSKSLNTKGTKQEQALAVGKEIAKLAKAKGVSEVVFDRGGYLYHGRVAAVADGAREGGLTF
jgi:large subunit ribosomal protein L18